MESENVQEPSPSAFLEKLKEVYKDVESLLTPRQKKYLLYDPSTPLQSKNDEEFAHLTVSYFEAAISIIESKTSLQTSLCTPHSVAKKIDVEDHDSVMQALAMVKDRLWTVWNRTLEITEKDLGEEALPRVIRLSRKLELSERETKILVYILSAQVGKSDQDDDYYGHRSNMQMNVSSVTFGNTPFDVCHACDSALREIIDFLAPDRTHMKQSLFDSSRHSHILQCRLQFDEISFRALVGADLKASEFLKIDQTCLADVILGEEGNEHLRVEDIEVSFDGPAPDKKTDEEKPAESASKEHKEGEEEETKEELMDLDELLKQERAREKEENIEAPVTTQDGEGDDKDDKQLVPYRSDWEYLDESLQLIAQMIKIKMVDAQGNIEDRYNNEVVNPHNLKKKREAQSKAKVLAKRCEKRLILTKQAGSWLPRLERMASARGFAGFEKNVLLTLIGFVIQPNKILPYEGMMYGTEVQPFSVGELLRLFYVDLQDQIKHRKYFYKNSTLVKEGMIIVHNSGLNGDPTSAKVEIDRRMFDFCVGLDTEFSEIVEGSHLYYPKTHFDQVVLAEEQKSLILNTVSNFEAYKKCRKRMGMDDAITYGTGMVILFHGEPGTGKTMMANALANKLGKKVLLINFPSLGAMSAGENFKFVFREAKINDAILFFDECEAIFETREKGSNNVNLLLTEIERHDGLIIMATNRPYDLDEAMHRRIMIAVEFRQPDHLLRKAIWKSHIPDTMKLGDDFDLDALSLRFELSGGFIKNAILSALSIAVSRDGDPPTVTQEDFIQGANLQLRGRLRMKDFHRRFVPSRGLDKVIVPANIMQSLKEIVQFEKARSILFGQWGFTSGEQEGLTCLFHGLPGTGKSLAAEAVGYEVGKPLKIVNCGELLSKWVGESAKNIDSIFQEARSTDAILVFDEAEGLFGQRTGMSTSTDRYANVDVGVLLYHIERFPGIIILTTNLIDNMDKALFRRLKFVLNFDIPNATLRAQLWKLLIPSETPLKDDIDFDRLSRHEMSGGNIKNCIFRAAARTAIREHDRVLNMSDLEKAAYEENDASVSQSGFRRH